MAANRIHKVDYGDIDEGQYHYGENGGRGATRRARFEALFGHYDAEIT